MKISEIEKEFDDNEEIHHIFHDEKKDLYWSENYIKSFYREKITELLEEVIEDIPDRVKCEPGCPEMIELKQQLWEKWVENSQTTES